MQNEPPHERVGSPEHGELQSETGAVAGVPDNAVPQWHSLLNSTPANKKSAVSQRSMQVAGVLSLYCVVTSPALMREGVSTAHAYCVVQLRGI